jgi:heme a synthase
VAGIDAGLSYNTWPKMDGAFIPTQLMDISPWWRNFFESPKTVQFVHRSTAYVLFLCAIINFIVSYMYEGFNVHTKRSGILCILIGMQAAIGIITLLNGVQFYTALLHQAMAFILLFFVVSHWKATQK